MDGTPLILIGAGGLAREVVAAVRADPDGRWDPIGVLDDDPVRHGEVLDGVPVLGAVERLAEHPDAAVLACVANPRRPASRLRLAERLSLPDQRWATVVHPSASVPDGAELGPGTVLLAGVVLTTPLRLRSHVLAMPHVLLTHDDEVDDGVTLAGRATLAGGVRLGPCAYVGQGALIREYITIGAEAMIGMGSVVLRDIPAGEIWAGSPARRLEARRGTHS